ncbi:DUF4240 domain-containing protein [Chitinophaga lutea]|uniref:DUF4240 domain-containing protein n=1 Tax=Chitinophaga lutea TaxID=2488634 RepID=A0A3N4PY18_9BACT|nr:DUF4240 domain-containing protein [Chitinophaga lutea]RPE12806.1 DUF4240 domain-containing protein [Chitinophaga lutea]
MNEQEFWKIIDRSAVESKLDTSLQSNIITEMLDSYTIEQMIEFEIIFRQLVIAADDFKILGAQKIIDGYVSDDSYLYFRCWLIGLGESTFREALQNPDILADVVHEGTVADFEELMYVTTTAFLKKTGKEEEDDSCPRAIALYKGYDYDFNTPPTKGTDWTEDQLPVLYPRLWAKFH